MSWEMFNPSGAHTFLRNQVNTTADYDLAPSFHGISAVVGGIDSVG